MLTFISISLTLLFIFEVTWRMEHSRYFFSSRMETLPFSYIWLKYDILMPSTVEVAWPIGYNIEVGTIGSGFDSRRSYNCVCRILVGTFRMFFFALKPCIAVRVGAAMPV